MHHFHVAQFLNFHTENGPGLRANKGKIFLNHPPEFKQTMKAVKIETSWQT
jgi:hypothetical protein